MYPEIPFWASTLLIAGGLWLLTWSANQFVGGAEAVTRAMGVSPFIVGMVVIGFGTSAPELAVSAFSGMTGHSNLSLGNAYGSNFFNTLAVIGLSGTIAPFKDVSPYILCRDLPMMSMLTLSIAIFGVNLKRPRSDGHITSKCGMFYFAAFVVYLALLISQEIP